MHKRLAICSILILGCFCLKAQSESNEGTSFWFGFMEHIDRFQNTKVAMITAKKATSGVIEIPLQGWSQSFNVAANEVTIVTLPVEVENIGSEQVSDKGVILTSNDPVSVYIHQYHNFRSEATVVIPTVSLGTEYYTMNYRAHLDNGIIYPSEFLIVADADSTLIDITVADETIGGYSPGSRHSVLLNRGETYQVQSREVNGDLTGSYVTGNKPFALFSGNEWTQVPFGCWARDNLLEQMYPISTLGTKFVAAPFAEASNWILRILAVEDNTTIQVEYPLSTQSPFTLNAGEFREIQASDPALITGDKAIIVAQFNMSMTCTGHNLGDPSMIVLNSIEQIRDTVTLYNSNFEVILENYINIITKSEDVDLVIMDGNRLVDQGVQFTTLGDFAYTTIPVSTGSHTIISEGCGVIALAYGYGEYESYAYSGGASFTKINANPIPLGGCLDEEITFDSGLPPNRYSLQWDLGDGTTQFLNSFKYTYDELGSYPVELIVEDLCLNTIDTLNRDLLVTLKQPIGVGPDVIACEDESFNLLATENSDTYSWTGPFGFESSDKNPIDSAASLENAGVYQLVGSFSGCETFPSFVEVEINENPEPDLGDELIFCSRDKFPPVLDPGLFESYLWNTQSTSSTVDVVF